MGIVKKIVLDRKTDEVEQTPVASLQITVELMQNSKADKANTYSKIESQSQLQSTYDLLDLYNQNQDSSIIGLQNQINALSGGKTTNWKDVLIDFGANETDFIIATIPATWVKADSKLTPMMKIEATADHTIEEIMLTSLILGAFNIVPDVSFDVIVYAKDLTYGKYNILVKGE